MQGIRSDLFEKIGGKYKLVDERLRLKGAGGGIFTLEDILKHL